MLFKLKFFEISCSEIERKEPGTRTLVTHEHNKQIGTCQFDKLDDITYKNPILQAMCVAPLAVNLSIMNIKNRYMISSNFDHDCPFIRGFGLDLHEKGLVSPHDEFPNICSELHAALEAAVVGSHLKIVTMESDVYVVSSVSDLDQFLNNVRNLHPRLSDRVISVYKVGIIHLKESLRDASIGDSLELLTMRLRQRICAICHASTDDSLSERRITCLPCSHLYHEDCIMLRLMKKSCCPLCGYRISFDEVECKLPCDWPRRHRQNRPNLYKIVERFAYKILGSCFTEIFSPNSPTVLQQILLLSAIEWFCYDPEMNIREELIGKPRKDNRRKLAESKVLMHCKNLNSKKVDQIHSCLTQD